MRKTVLGAIMMICLAVSVCPASDWPQYQHDAQRTGYSPDQIDGPYRAAWVRNFVPADKLHPAAQMIVAEGRGFIGTRGGWFYALDPATGGEIWKYKAGGGIQHTAGARAGLVFFGALDGCVYALNAADGTLVWKYVSPGELLRPGFSCAVCLAEGKVFIPRRDGLVVALDQKSGAAVWTHETGVFTRAGAACWGGRVYVCTEDMRIRCLSSKDGATVWESEQVYGGSWGDFCPVVIEGRVLAQVMRSVPGQGTVPPVFDEDGLTGPPGMLDGKPVLWWAGGQDKSHGLMEVNTPQAAELRQRIAVGFAEGRRPEEIEELKAYNLFDDGLDYFKANPRMVTLQVRDAKTGMQQVVAHVGHPMMGGPPTPPVRWKDGTIITAIPFGNFAFCRVDLATGRVVDVLLNVLAPEEIAKAPGTSDWEAKQRLRTLFNLGIGSLDETVNLSAAGDMVYVLHTHDEAFSMQSGAYDDGVFDMRRRRWHGRRTYEFYEAEGTVKPIRHGDPFLRIIDENRSGGGSPAVISGQFWYHVTTDSMIIARTSR